MTDDVPRQTEPTAWHAAIGTMVFTVVVPGSAVVLGPYLFTGWRVGPPLFGTDVSRWLGAALVLLGAPPFVDFLVRFVVEGRGTPAPIAPTRHLVVRGPFRYVRNPAYICVVAMVVGQGLFFASLPVLAYAVTLALAFHLFVVLYEEPTLRATFGAEYEDYCRRVPRWVPRPGARGRSRPDG